MGWHRNIVKKGKFDISLRTNAEYQPLIVSFFFPILFFSVCWVEQKHNTEKWGYLCFE